MSDEEIDDVDRAILYALQEDARNTSSGDIAERTDTSDSTIRKRIQRLESDGVITPVAKELLEMGLAVADEVLLRSHETTPFGEFDPERPAKDGN